MLTLTMTACFVGSVSGTNTITFAKFSKFERAMDEGWTTVKVKGPEAYYGYRCGYACNINETCNSFKINEDGTCNLGFTDWKGSAVGDPVYVNKKHPGRSLSIQGRKLTLR